MAELGSSSSSAPALAQFSDDPGQVGTKTGFTTSPTSPGISVELHGGDPTEVRPGLVSHL